MSKKTKKTVTYKDFKEVAKSWNKSTCTVHSNDRLSAEDDFLDKQSNPRKLPSGERLTKYVQTSLNL